MKIVYLLTFVLVCTLHREICKDPEGCTVRKVDKKLLDDAFLVADYIFLFYHFSPATTYQDYL